MKSLEILNDNSGAALVVLTAVYVVGTFVIAWVSTASVREQKKTRRAMERPRVVAYLENDSERHVAVFVLRNTGRGTATNVSVVMDPPLLNPKHPNLSIDEGKPLFSQGTPIMVPEYEIRSLAGVYGNWPTPPEPMPVAHVSYFDISNQLKFEESYPLDMGAFFGMPSSSPKGVHSVAEELEKLNRTLGDMSRKITSIAGCDGHPG